MSATVEKTRQIDELLKQYFSRYKKNKTAIEVSFRKILPELNNVERYSHLIHTYPAKLLMHIPYFFLNNSYFSKEGDVVLDPFCGTGTVLLEASLTKRIGLGSDANPLARLIAKVKNTQYDKTDLESTLAILIKRSKNYKRYTVPDVVNIDYWYTTQTKQGLAKLLTAIMKIKDDKKRDFFLVCLSNCARKVSFADPRVSVPVKLNPGRYRKNSTRYKTIEKEMLKIKKINVFERFQKICIDNIVRIEKLNASKKLGKVRIISSDARDITRSLFSKIKLPEESVNLIITSPPYAGAQKYIRASSLGLCWTGLVKENSLSTLDAKNIGREQFKATELTSILKTKIKEADELIKVIYDIDKVRAAIAANYLVEMQKAIDEVIRVLKPGGYLVLIVGNNQICRLEFNTQQYLTQYLIRKKLKCRLKLIDGIKSYGLMTKRNKTADIITREYVLVFQK